MVSKQAFNMVLVALLLLTVNVAPAFAAMDDIYSDDKILGFDKNKDYDAKGEVNLQEGIDSASSLPIWGLAILAILLLAVAVILVVPGVIQWNILKGGKSATNENPTKAAQGIKDAKMVNREFIAQAGEGFIFIAILAFAVGLFL